jgi:hypothetical protein
LLVSVLDYSNAVKMPPGAKLPDETVAAVRRWIDLGAPWSTLELTAAPAATGDDTWAFRPLKKVAPPTEKGNPIDAFIDAKLRERKITAAFRTGFSVSTPLPGRSESLGIERIKNGSNGGVWMYNRCWPGIQNGTLVQMETPAKLLFERLTQNGDTQRRRSPPQGG